MREIKFRALNMDTKEWRYFSISAKGDPGLPLICVDKDAWLLTYTSEFYTALTEYTALTDRNGKEIYEGDIVEGGFDKLKGVITFGMYKPVMNTDEWEGHQSFYIQWHDWNGMTRGDLGYWLTKMEISIEVVGNIYENPELLQ